MDKELIDDIEKKIYMYYKKESYEKELRYKLNLLNNQIEAINKDLKECNFKLETGIKSPTFEERVQTSSDGTSYAEREFIRILELKEKRKEQKEIAREKILEKLDNLEIAYNSMQLRLKDFKGQSKQILELKYRDGLNEIRIAQILHLDQSRVNRKKRKIIEKIAMWDMWLDSIKNA